MYHQRLLSVRSLNSVREYTQPAKRCLRGIRICFIGEKKKKPKPHSARPNGFTAPRVPNLHNVCWELVSWLPVLCKDEWGRTHIHTATGARTIMVSNSSRGGNTTSRLMIH